MAISNCYPGVLKDLKRIPPVHQITMLKFIKNLSMLTATLETLQNANAIEVLTDLLQQSINGSHFRVGALSLIYYHVTNTIVGNI